MNSMHFSVSDVNSDFSFSSTFVPAGQGFPDRPVSLQHKQNGSEELPSHFSLSQPSLSMQLPQEQISPHNRNQLDPGMLQISKFPSEEFKIDKIQPNQQIKVPGIPLFKDFKTSSASSSATNLQGQEKLVINRQLLGQTNLIPQARPRQKSTISTDIHQLQHDSENILYELNQQFSNQNQQQNSNIQIQQQQQVKQQQQTQHKIIKSDDLATDFNYPAEIAPFPESHPPSGLIDPSTLVFPTEKQMNRVNGAKQLSALQKQRQNEQKTFTDFDNYSNQSKRKKLTLWGEEENQTLLKLVDEFGPKNWSTLAAKIKEQTGKDFKPDAVCQHYHRVLNSDISHEKWTAEQDALLIDAVKNSQKGKWKEVAERLGNRTDVQVRARLERIKTKLIEKGVLGPDWLP